jgi:hypothetical protein
MCDMVGPRGRYLCVLCVEFGEVVYLTLMWYYFRGYFGLDTMYVL